MERRQVGNDLTDIRKKAQGIFPDVVEQIRAIFEHAKEDQTLDFINYSQHFTTLVQIVRRRGTIGEREKVKK